MSNAAQQALAAAPPPRSDEVAVAAPTRMARVVSVSGAQAVAVVDQGARESGEGRIEMGALMKIATPRSTVMGLISAVTTPMPEDRVAQTTDIELVELNLAGEIVTDETGKRSFRRGVTCVPSVGDPCYLAQWDDLRVVYASPGRSTIDVGTLFQDGRVPARLLIDELFGKHFIVVGTTGCGKSSTLTCILQSAIAGHEHARIVMLDIHNEYPGAFGEMAELVDQSNLRLPFWLLNFNELVAAFVSTDHWRDAEIEILSEAVLAAKRKYSEAQASRLRRTTESAGITVDTPTPFRLSDVVAVIDDNLGKLERAQAATPYRRLKTRVEALVADPRYSFMFGSLMIEDTMTSILGQIFRVPTNGKPVTVINLAAVPTEILDVVISLISRLAFDLAVWSEGSTPMLLVCEEAHRYAPTGHDDDFMPTRAALSRIAKEGRKYGVSLALITQRPSDLDPTIMSQCSTVVAMRLSTDRDQQVVRANTHEGALDLLDFLPLLGDREAIILGEGVVMPMRVRFRDINTSRLPTIRHEGFSKGWRSATFDTAALEEVVRRWRLSLRAKA
jgi:DNA helicase HerA-like ATPase